MKVIKPSYEILDRRELHAAQKIEYAGRTAYKSEDKITDTSSFEFLQKMTDLRHFPVLEFANVHLLVECHTSAEVFNEKLIEFVSDGGLLKYMTMSSYESNSENTPHLLLISGTVRAWLELISKNMMQTADGSIMNSVAEALNNDNLFFPLKFTDDKGELLVTKQDPNIKAAIVSPLFVQDQLKNTGLRIEKHLMCAVKFICNRAVTHELVRHRPVTIIQESQRYCRYSASKFNKEVTFIEPSAFFACPGDFPDHPAMDSQYTDYYLWEKVCATAEEIYMMLIERGASAQAARTVLPNSCKTEIIIYATIEEWRHIFAMRVPPTAEPSMRQLTVPLEKEFFSKENMAKWE